MEIQGDRCLCGHVIVYTFRPDGEAAASDSAYGWCSNTECPHFFGANWVATNDRAILKPTPRLLR